MSFVEAAALPMNWFTSHHAIVERGRVDDGETVLVHAAAGGVGSAAVQLAHARGARVIATAGGPDKVRMLRERLGVSTAIDYRSEDLRSAVLEATAGAGVDVVFDPVGGDVFDISRRLVRPGGRYLVVGFTSGRIPELATNHVLLKGYSLVGVHWGQHAGLDPAATARTWQAIVELHRSGSVDPLVEAPTAFHDAPEAFMALGARTSTGKLVVLPPSEE